MGTKVVKPSSVEIIPSTQLTGIESAIATIVREEELLPILQKEATEFTVNSKESFMLGGELLKRIRAGSKQGEEQLKPFKKIVKAATDWLNNKIKMHEMKFATIETIITTKLNEYQRQEREQAAKEQRELNDRRRKEENDRIERDRLDAAKKADEKKKERIAEIKKMEKEGKIGKREMARLLKEAGAVAEAQIEAANADAEDEKMRPIEQMQVLPNTPAVAGLMRRTKWSYQIVNQEAITRKYLAPDEVAIGKMVRGMHNNFPDTATREQIKEAAERECPGIVVKFEDSI